MNFIVKRIQTGNLFTNTYIVMSKNTPNCVVIDPAHDNGEVRDFLESNNLNLSAVFVTHGHFDHVGGVKALVGDKDIPVYGSANDAELAAKASKNRFGVPCNDCAITKYVKEGEPIIVDDFKFEVLETPGHTPGSVCYILGDYLFSGDTLMAGTVGRTDLEGGSYTSLKQSLKKISNLDKNYFICPGHQSTTSLLHELENNTYLIKAKNL